MDKYLSPAQSAYRNGRSTTDIVWAYRWTLAKVQKCRIEIYSAGIDMTAAFDTIDRSKLMSLIEEIAEPDVARMVRCLLSNTTLEVKMPGCNTNVACIIFESNVGSPQGDSLSGPLFTLYFEMSLRELRKKIQITPMEADHNYGAGTMNLITHTHQDYDHSYHIETVSNSVEVSVEEHDYQRTSTSFLPKEMVYADDADRLTMDHAEERLYLKHATTVLKEDNLGVNESKTELLKLQRGDRNTETWRESMKLGSLLGDAEDIKNRKDLAAAAFQRMDKAWLDRRSVNRELKLQLLDTAVMSVFFYNSSCWGLRRCDIEGIDSLHRRFLRKILNISWPETISNKALYKVTKVKPAEIRITRARWQYFGHALRLDVLSPPQQAMDFYFAPVSAKCFPGKRCTIVTTLQADIKRTQEFIAKLNEVKLNKNNNCKLQKFQIEKLSNHSDLKKLRVIASDRVTWRRITKSVVDAAEANRCELE